MFTFVKLEVKGGLFQVLFLHGVKSDPLWVDKQIAVMKSYSVYCSVLNCGYLSIGTHRPEASSGPPGAGITGYWPVVK